jgi:inorganic triphosphatase YgiF
MATEVELKLEVPPGTLRALGKASWLKKMAEGPAARRKLVSVYFDTRKRELREKGLSLRVRRANGHFVQTVKSGGDYRREEWEEEIEGARPDRPLARHTTLKPFTSKKAWRRLRPVFETEIARTVIPVQSGDSHIEVALDHGRVKSGRHVLPVSEVELELKQGRVSDLNRLAARIAKDGAGLGLASKAERGYALADDSLQDHIPAAPIALGARMSAADGFRTIGFSCLHHLTANRQAILAGDAEGVHQMRVGLRRLRAALSLFKTMIEGDELETVKSDLKWLTEQLADARDFDVLVKESVAPLQDDAPAGLKALKKDIEARRDHGFAQARKAVQSPRYRRVVLQTGLWLTGGDWAASEDDLRRDLRDKPLCNMARDILEQRSAKVMKKLRKLERMDDRQRHKLRIAVKKLRYGVGFFESLFGKGGRRKRFAAGLKDLQSALGRLNDIRVHRTFARKEVRGKKQLSHGAYALGVLTGQERKAVKPCLDAAAKAGKRLRGLEPFWT